MIVFVAVALTFFGVHQGSGCAISNYGFNSTIKASVGTRISLICLCHRNGNMKPYWTIKGQQYPTSTGLDRGAHVSCCTVGGAFIESNLTLTVSSDSGLVCCEMKESPQWCFYLQPQQQTQITLKTKISTTSYYLGDKKWNLTVICWMGISVSSYRDMTLMALIFNGITSNPYFSQKLPIDGYSKVDGVLLYTRTAHFSHLVTGQTPVIPGCFVTFNFDTNSFVYENVTETVFHPVIPSPSDGTQQTPTFNSSLHSSPTASSTNDQTSIYHGSLPSRSTPLADSSLGTISYVLIGISAFIVALVVVSILLLVRSLIHKSRSQGTVTTLLQHRRDAAKKPTEDQMTEQPSDSDIGQCKVKTESDDDDGSNSSGSSVKCFDSDRNSPKRACGSNCFIGYHLKDDTETSLFDCDMPPSSEPPHTEGNDDAEVKLEQQKETIAIAVYTKNIVSPDTGCVETNTAVTHQRNLSQGSPVRRPPCHCEMVIPMVQETQTMVSDLASQLLEGPGPLAPAYGHSVKSQEN